MQLTGNSCAVVGPKTLLLGRIQNTFSSSQSGSENWNDCVAWFLAWDQAEMTVTSQSCDKEQKHLCKASHHSVYAADFICPPQLNTIVYADSSRTQPINATFSITRGSKHEVHVDRVDNATAWFGGFSFKCQPSKVHYEASDASDFWKLRCEHSMYCSMVCLRHQDASPAIVRSQWFSWTSSRNSQQPQRAWFAVSYKEPTEVHCIEILQHRQSLCPILKLESSDDGDLWYEEKGWVISYFESTDVVHGLIGQGVLTEDIPPGRTVLQDGRCADGVTRFELVHSMTECSASENVTFYELGKQHGPPGSLWSLLFLLLLVASFIPWLICCLFCSTFELWYELEKFTYDGASDFESPAASPSVCLKTCAATLPLGREAPTIEPQGVGEQRKSLRIKIVSYPRWLLDGTSLSNTIRRKCSELTIVPEEIANKMFPLLPLRDFEAVVAVPIGCSIEDVGRMMQALLEQRRLETGAALSWSRRPRFQAVAATWGTFLHFGGSLGCGHRRWRSCPSRLPSDKTAFAILT